MTKVEILCEGGKIYFDSEIISKYPVLLKLCSSADIPVKMELTNFSKSTLEKVREFCEHYRHSVPQIIQKPLKSWDLFESGIDSWDAEFIDINSLESLVDLIVCADFLEIHELVQLGCAKIASIIGHQNNSETTADSSLGATGFTQGLQFN